ncbi:MAG: hypothetical protein FGM37_04405 [Phycisphaerales bacterium]|nr:hypothetical protein [Phycisphaerales bacterium]
MPARGLFEDLASAAMTLGREMRSCVAPLLEDQPSIRELAQALGIDKSLAWQVHHIATASDPVPILAALPGPAGMAKVMQALVSAGRDTTALERARAALVYAMRRRGFSRTQLKSMVTGQWGDVSERGALRQLHRRAHEANAAIQGISIGGTAVAVMLLPGGTPKQMTLVAATLLHRFCRTLNSGPIPVYYRTQQASEAASPAPRHSRRSRKGTMASLVRELCSPEVLDEHLSTVDCGDGEALCYQPPPSASNRVDFAFREIGHGVRTLREDRDGDAGQTGVALFNPMEHAMVDLMFHESMPVSDVTVHMHRRTAPEPIHMAGPDFLRHPIEIDARWIADRTPPAPFASAGTRWEALVEGCAKAVRQDVGSFRTFRIRVDYPLTPSEVRIGWTWRSGWPATAG